MSREYVGELGVGGVKGIITVECNYSMNTMLTIRL